MHSNDAGFSLVEVLVALAISALLMAAVYRGLALGTRGLRVSDVESRLTEVARTQLARAGVDTPLAEGEQTGRSGNIHWTVTISPYVSPVAPVDPADTFGKPRAFWVEVEVRAQGRPARRLTTVKLSELTK